MTRTTSVPMKKTSILARPTLLGASIALAFAGGFAYADPLALWQFTTTQASSPTAQASRAVQINASALANLQNGSEFTINLSNTAPLTAVLKQTISHSSGNKTIVAQLKGYDSAYSLVLTTGSQGSFGDLRSPDGEYQILSNNGQDWVVDLKASGLNPAANQDRSTLVPPPRGGQNSNTNSAEASTIDLLLLYTPELANQYGTALQARLDHLVALSNVAYQDSGVNLTLRLVHQEAVTSSTTSNADTLQALTQSQGDFANVGALRNQYGADLVALLRPLSAEHRNCGTAWINGANGQDIKQYADYGYAVVSDGLNTNTKQYCSDYSLTQSLAHNMGSLAERSEYSDGLQGAYPYAYDHVVLGQFGTLMSAMTPKLGVFSNPDQLCLGTRCGVAEDQPSAANNAKALNQTRSVVANFRATVVPSGTKAQTTSSKTNAASLSWNTTKPQSVSKPSVNLPYACLGVYDAQTGLKSTTSFRLALAQNTTTFFNVPSGQFRGALNANTAYLLQSSTGSALNIAPATISIAQDMNCPGANTASGGTLSDTITATGGTLNSVTVSGAQWSTNQWVGYRLIIGNDNVKIIANDSENLYLASPLASLPTQGSIFSLEAAFYVSSSAKPSPSTIGKARFLRGLMLDASSGQPIDLSSGLIITAKGNTAGSGDGSCSTANNPNSKGEFYCVVHDGWGGTVIATKPIQASSAQTNFTVRNSPISVNAGSNDDNSLTFLVDVNSITPSSTDANNNGIADWLEVDSDGDGIPDRIESAVNKTSGSASAGSASNPYLRDNYVLSDPLLFANQLWRDTYGGNEFTSQAWISKLTTNQSLFNGTALQPARPLTRAELVVESMRAGNATTPGNPMYIAYPLRVLRHMYAFLGAPAQNNAASLDAAQFKFLVAKLIQANTSQFLARQAPADFSVLDTLLGTNNSYLTGAVDAAFIKDAKIRAGMAVDGQGNPIALAIDSNTNLTTRAAYLSALAESDEYLSSSGIKRKIFTSSTMFVLLAAADWNTWNTLFSNSQTYPDNLSIVSALFSFKDGQGNYIYNKRFFDGPNLTFGTSAPSYDVNGTPSVTLSPNWAPVVAGQTAAITRYSDGVCSVADNAAQLPASVISGNTYTDSSLPSDISKTLSYKLLVNDNGAPFTACQSVAVVDHKKPSITNAAAQSTNGTAPVNLSWASSDGSGINAALTTVSRFNGSCGTGSPVAMTVNGSNSSDASAITGQSYCYRISVTDNVGNTQTQDVPFAFADTFAPNTPAAPTVSGTPTGSSVSIQWQAVTDNGGGQVAGYKVYRNGTLLGSVAANVLSYTDNTVAGSTSYNYTVAAYDNATPANTSTQSAALAVTTPVSTDPYAFCSQALPGRSVTKTVLSNQYPTSQIAFSNFVNNILVIEFTTGSQPNTNNSYVGLAVTEQSTSNVVPRTMSVSNRPCDFTYPVNSTTFDDNAFGIGDRPGVYVSVGNSVTGFLESTAKYRVLQPNTTYYINIINSDMQTQTERTKTISDPNYSSCTSAGGSNCPIFWKINTGAWPAR